MLLDRFREAKAEEIALLTDMASRPGAAAPVEGAQAGLPESHRGAARRAVRGRHCGVQAVLPVARRHRHRAETGGSGGTVCRGGRLLHLRADGGTIFWRPHRVSGAHEPRRASAAPQGLHLPPAPGDGDGASTPASALLLIVRLTPDARTLRILREQAEAYGHACRGGGF